MQAQDVLTEFGGLTRPSLDRNYDEAIKVMQRATAIPKNWRNISFHDEVRFTLRILNGSRSQRLMSYGMPMLIPPLLQSLATQQRLFKSLKLWSFFVDLEESIGTVETTKSAYDKIFELKIANAQVVINYANFLEENEYWEESFKVRRPFAAGSTPYCHLRHCAYPDSR